MKAVAKEAKAIINQASVVDNRRESDTIRLWESYRDQATLWRAIALLQIPATIAALIFGLLMYGNQKIVLNVPAKPMPGIYAAQDIPDTEYMDFATDFLNLIASYQQKVARRQFEEAAKMVHGNLLAVFNRDYLNAELKTVETTNRTQIFYVDPTKTAIDRAEQGKVTVSMIGDRLKIIAGQELPLQRTKFSVTMTTMPKNKLNDFGIVVTDFSFEEVR